MENVVPGNLQRLRAADIIRMAGLAAASVGQEYYRSGAVHSMSRQATLLVGIVELRASSTDVRQEQAQPPHAQENDDTSLKMAPQRFPVEVELLSLTSWRSKCSCHPDTQRQETIGVGLAPAQPLCSHGAALLYQWLAQPALFQTEDDQRETSAKSDLVGVKSTHKKEESDLPTGGRKITVEVGTGGSHPPTTPIFPTEEQTELPIQRYFVGSTLPENLLTILSQLSLSELRAMAREYDLTVNGMSKPQLAESIRSQLKKPDVVRHVATTLEKSQRQLLAALILAGGVVSDDDLRGLFERFSLGQPSQLQQMLLILQSKALLFRTSLNASNMAQRSHHGLLNSALLDIGWYVPWDVCNALRVSVPITPFDVTNVDARGTRVGPVMLQLAEISGPLSMLLLLARMLDGYTPGPHETWYERSELKRSSEAGWGKPGSYGRSSASITDTPGLSSSDGSVALPPPEDLPPPSLFQELQERILGGERAVPTNQFPLESQSTFLRFIIRVLGVADLFHKGDGRSPSLSLRSGTAERLLGPDWSKTLRTLFKQWLIHTSYGDLYDLTAEHIHLRCRATSQYQPVLRSADLEAENSQARQNIVALLAQAPLNQWISFSSFARFVYRLNPLFLQRRYVWGRASTGSSAPQWWLEQDEGRSLRPSLLSDWLRAELFYLRRMIAGALHWWGACDIATSADGQLLAFRLTPMAAWLFNGVLQEHVGTGQRPALPLQWQEEDYQRYVASLEVTDASEILVSCSVQNWPVIQLFEMFTLQHPQTLQYPQTDLRTSENPLPSVPSDVDASNGTISEMPTDLPLAYRISAKAFGLALGRGLRPFVLLRLLRLAAAMKAASNPKQAQLFTQIATQLEQWHLDYSRVRLYTGVTLLETVDAAVMREVVATTSLEESVVQNIHPTLCIVKPNMIGQIVDELKQRGQSPLLHDEDF